VQLLDELKLRAFSTFHNNQVLSSALADACQRQCSPSPKYYRGLLPFGRYQVEKLQNHHHFAKVCYAKQKKKREIAT
jgi:hypothetical protein